MRCVNLGAMLAMFAGCGFSPREAPADATVIPGDAPETCGAPATHGCSGRVVRTCGADHQWDMSQDHACDFTCSVGACVTASNVPLADIAACTASAPALTPPSGATVVLTGGTPSHLDCSPNCGVPAVTRINATELYATPAPGLSMFCLAKIDLQGTTTLTLAPGAGPREAIAFIVDDTVTLASGMVVDGTSATAASSGGRGGPGGYDGAPLSSDAGKDGTGPCHGRGGSNDGPFIGDDYSGGGGGGGGNGSVGGIGGDGSCVDGDHHGLGGLGGGVCNAPPLVPLVGGSGGGGGGDATINGPYGYAGGGGGGALQISARGTIAITGMLSARGGAGFGLASVDGGGGGGAGGSLLLEAPTLAITGQLVVDGGAGGLAGAGPGGAGASGASLAISGQSYANDGQGGSGGGGGAGRIRLVGGNATCVSGVSPTTSCTTAALVVVP